MLKCIKITGMSIKQKDQITSANTTFEVTPEVFLRKQCYPLWTRNLERYVTVQFLP